MKKLFILLSISLLTSLVACNKSSDTSNNPTPTSKCQNGGTLVNGICECPFGYEGDYCDIESRQKFVGICKGTQSLNGEKADSHTFEIKKTNGVTKIRISGGGIEMEAELTDTNKFKIAKQEYVLGTDVFDIVGNGKLVDNTLSISYSLKAQKDGLTLTYRFEGKK